MPVYQTNSQPTSRQRRYSTTRRQWRLVVSLVTAFAFALLVTTSVAHVHKLELQTHNCAICSAVLDKITGSPSAPAAVQQVQFLSHYLVAVIAEPNVRVPPELNPPSCGPPRIPA